VCEVGQRYPHRAGPGYDDHLLTAASQRGRLRQSGVLVRTRHSTRDHAQLTGYQQARTRYDGQKQQLDANLAAQTQQRDVLPTQIGREPIFPWEAKVYTLA